MPHIDSMYIAYYTVCDNSKQAAVQHTSTLAATLLCPCLFALPRITPPSFPGFPRASFSPSAGSSISQMPPYVLIWLFHSHPNPRKAPRRRLSWDCPPRSDISGSMSSITTFLKLKSLSASPLVSELFLSHSKIAQQVCCELVHNT